MRLNRCVRAFSSDVNTNRTALYDWHISKGAKMTEYAGWEMPVQYKDQSMIDSHLRTRSRASLFDVSHMLQLNVTGEHRAEFLESLLVGDIEGLQKDHAVLSLLTNHDGGIIDDTVVTNLGDRLGMVLNAGCAEKDLAHLEQYELEWRSCGKDVYITHQDRSLLALQGPLAMYILRTFTGRDSNIDINEIPFMTRFKSHVRDIPIDVTRCGYTGEDGFEISVENKHATALARELTSFVECKAAGLASRDTLRLEAGLCLYGNDIDETTTPVEAGLAWTIPKRRRDPLNPNKFPGWNIIMDQLKNGAEKVTRKRVGIMTPYRRPPRKDSVIFNNKDEPVGKVTSGLLSPTLNRGIGMAYIDKPYHTTSTEGLYIDIRETTVPIEVVKMPFVKANYYK
jgi:aminomethyltransferase